MYREEMLHNGVILTTANELRNIIGEEVRRVVPELANYRRRTEAVKKERLSTTEAVNFLNEQGLSTTLKSLYAMVFKQAIPYCKIGRRTYFMRAELLDWIEQRTSRPEDSKERAGLLIEKSIANRQKRARNGNKK